MRFKPDVRVQGVRPELLLGILAADEIFTHHGYEMVITSLLEGAHSKTSLHYSGCAADFRTSHPSLAIPKSTIEAIADDLRKALTVDYDVVIERDHLHLEYQPRRA